VPTPSFFAPLRGLPGRVGQAMIAPRAALERVDREGGGLRDALWLVALATVTFRFPQLLEALLGLSEPSVDALLRVVSVASNEVVAAAWVVLPAAVVITALAGAHRDSSRDLELGAACYAPYFAASAAFRVVEAVTGGRTWSPMAARLVAAAVALPALARAVLVARRRGGFPAGVITQPRRAALAAGLALVGASSIGLAGNAVWSARHLEDILPVRSGAHAPDFSLPRVDGPAGTVALAPLRGQVVVLDFWATYCPPCRLMMPILDELHGEWSSKGVSFVGVNGDGDLTPAMLQEFLATHPMPYPSVADDGALGASYKVRALPTLFVIGKDGAIRQSFVGFTSKATLERALAHAVAGG
jgi:thiol-disulfide isomerase/thioredoxin